MRTEKVRFPGGFADYTLVGRLDLPDEGEPRAYALFAHCFTCTKNLTAIANISRALADEGFGVFRFDFTGLGESEGEFADTNFSSNVADLVAAASFMEQEYTAPQILIGHSLGGAAILLAAHQIPAVEAVVTIATPYQPEHISRLLLSKQPEIETEGEATVMLAGRPFTIRRQFLEDLESRSLEDKIGNLERPLLIFHSPQDRIVAISNAAQIFRAARHPKSFVSLAGADHLLQDDADSQYVGRMVATWAGRYL